MLPLDLRILLTYCPEDDIRAALDKHHVQRRILGDLAQDAQSTEADIRMYIQHKLSIVPILDPTSPHRQWLNELVKRSGNLFQWASTACNFIAGPEAPPGSAPCDQLDIIMESSLFVLDDLY